MSEKLYHYTSSTTALEHILTNGQLRFGKIESTNDPRETKDWYLSLNLSGNINNVPYDELQRHFNMEKKRARLLCFSQDQDDSYGGDTPDFSHYEILKKGYCRSRMWANYAENHKGMCLEFDKDLLISSINEQLDNMGTLYSAPVQYINYSPENHQSTSFDLKEIQTEGLSQVVERQLSNYYHHVFFEKLLDWRDESEYRFLYIPSNENGEVYIDIRSSLTNIYVGINYDYSNTENLMGIIGGGRYLNIEEPKQLLIRNSTLYTDLLPS